MFSVYVWAGFLGGPEMNPPASVGELVRFLGWEDPPGEGNGNPLQHSCLENLHGQRSQEGRSPRGHKELDTAE